MESVPKPFNGEKLSLQQMVLGQMNMHMQDNEVWSLLQIKYKINSKQIKGLNMPVMAKIINLSKQKHRVNIQNLRIGSG